MGHDNEGEGGELHDNVQQGCLKENVHVNEETSGEGNQAQSASCELCDVCISPFVVGGFPSVKVPATGTKIEDEGQGSELSETNRGLLEFNKTEVSLTIDSQVSKTEVDVFFTVKVKVAESVLNSNVLNPDNFSVLIETSNSCVLFSNSFPVIDSLVVFIKSLTVK